MQVIQANGLSLNIGSSGFYFSIVVSLKINLLLIHASRYRQAEAISNVVNLLGKKSRICKTNNYFSHLSELLTL